MLAVLVASTLGIAACSSGTSIKTSNNSSDTSASASTSATDAGAGITGVQTFTGLSRNHTTDKVDYPQSPPVGGDHAPVWQNCGVYDAPIENGHAVHSLEHGAVWLAYRPDLPADQVAIVAAFATNQSHVLVSPYPGLTDAVVVTAWGVQLRLSSVTDPRLAQFVQMYQEGPQTPELGVTCSGGFGKPIA